ncbi:UBX domain-containing protein 4 [Sparus aurata]|uniref:UBX domain-containing protein 4 n=1 Tax=Sparus aurata TaxID=8175 RepID=UPI0011C1938E|nr:UBX domain-containing protein 4 [Sparus aurata]
MLWFEGSIPDAIISAKQQSCVFVVVISGEDEQSAQLMSSWEEDSVSEAAQNCCVAIKVDAKSETCVQFSEIYPVVCIPSSFFIGENGIPLEVIAGSVSAEELIKRINRVKQVGVKILDCVQHHLYYYNKFDADRTKSQGGVRKRDDGSQALAENVSSDDATQCSQSEEDLDAQVERLTKKLEEKQEQRKIGEENEIKMEIERRKVGKDMQDLKRKQEEEKTKRLREERNREKAEEKAARERVKQQIALDRADRAARYAKTQEDENAAKMTLLHAKQAEQEVRKEALLRERSTKARIQFRLPDGSSFTNQFHPQSKLQEAQHFAVQEVGNRYGNFSLATMFPRREFTSEDMQKTLLELELAPSASIVLLPQSGRPGHAVVQSSEGGIWAVLGTLLYPLLAVWRFLSSFLFANPRPRGAASRGSSIQSNSYINSDSDKAKRETLSKHNLEKRPKDFKKDGKICRLRTQDDSEDDNNTWNGNSTQQM